MFLSKLFSCQTKQPPPPYPPRKSAVIGIGYLGRYHVEKFAASPRAELIALVDTGSKHAAKLAKKYGVPLLTDYRELLDHKVECVSVVTPTSTHYEITKWLLEHGIDVLVEKPITTTCAEAEELTKIAGAQGRILQVGHLERFNPAFREMKAVLTEPRFFEVRRIAPFTGRGLDVDVVRDLMIHDIDIVAHLVGKPLLKVEAVGVPVLTKSADIANARLTFEGGAIANCTASRVAIKTERTLRMFQPDVYISLDYGKKKLKIHTRSQTNKKGLLANISITEHAIEERDALADEIDSFLDCVASRTEPEVTGEDGRQAVELADRINRAIEQTVDQTDPIQAVGQKAC